MRAAWLADAVCPGIVHSQVRYKELLRQILQSDVRWLDLGCGHNVIRPWALDPGEDELSLTHLPLLSIGIDSDVAALHANKCTPHRVAASMDALPFPENSFELVTANMVLEHSNDPVALMSEVWRVLSPGGTFVFHTPNKYFPASMIAALLPGDVKSHLVERLTNRRSKDVYPTYYRINTQRQIRRCSQAVGFDVEHLEMLESLSFNRYYALFLFNLLVARLLRWKALRNLQADFLVTLRKPVVATVTQPVTLQSNDRAARAVQSVA
jgi:ubiquinone/menaquinone biosynthesis C-methylase UbiE